MEEKIIREKERRAMRCLAWWSMPTALLIHCLRGLIFMCRDTNAGACMKAREQPQLSGSFGNHPPCVLRQSLIGPELVE